MIKECFVAELKMYEKGRGVEVSGPLSYDVIYRDEEGNLPENVPDYFASNVFNESVMKEKLPKSVYKSLLRTKQLSVKRIRNLLSKNN